MLDWCKKAPRPPKAECHQWTSLHQLRAYMCPYLGERPLWTEENSFKADPLPLSPLRFLPRAVAAPVTSKMIGIQVGAVSFVDEGVEKVLDEFQTDAAINTLFVATFTYGRGIAGRQVPGQPLPDHGKQSYDTDNFFGGCYTAVDPKYFASTHFKNFRAPDFGNYDVLESVFPPPASAA
jgi:hypothetical protein